MKPIVKQEVQLFLDSLHHKLLYLHLEITNGAYAAHRNPGLFSVGAFIRNGIIQFQQAKITGDSPYRVGLKMEEGWVYAEGLTDWEIDDDRLLLAGHDADGKLAVALQLSDRPFD